MDILNVRISYERTTLMTLEGINELTDFHKRHYYIEATILKCYIFRILDGLELKTYFSSSFHQSEDVNLFWIKCVMLLPYINQKTLIYSGSSTL